MLATLWCSGDRGCAHLVPGLNPQFDDRSPLLLLLLLLREGDLDAIGPAVIDRARPFLAGGQVPPSRR